MSGLKGRGGLDKSDDRVLSGSPVDLWGGDEYKPSKSSRRSVLGNEVALDTRRGCGNPACSAAWAKPWKSRRRPIFEGQWGCGSKCLQALVRNAVKRELGEGEALENSRHRHRIPLGLVMLAQGWITHPQLRRALEEQKAAGVGKIGQWLEQECGLSQETVTRGLSVQWSCPVLSLEGFEPRAMALTMPKRFVEEFELLPLRIAGKRILYMGYEDHLDPAASFSLQQMTDLKIESGLLEREVLASARGRLLECSFIPAASESVRDSEQMTQRVAELVEERQPIGARLVKMHQYYWLRTWLETGAQSGSGTVPLTSEDVADTIFTVGLQA